MFEVPSIVVYSVSFLLIALAAQQAGKLFSSWGLPYITGYLFTGALAGPFILHMLPEQATEQLEYVDHISLAVIAFIAGGELYFVEIRSKLRSILTNAGVIVLFTFSLLGTALFFAQSFIPFTADYPLMTKLAVALLGATILLALSPASTIAVIKEVKAKGNFSKTVLSITVVMDVVIIVLFALSVAFAGAMIDSHPVTLSFIGILLLDIVIAIAVGFMLGKLIGLMLSTPLDKSVKIALLILLGYLVFEASYLLHNMSHDFIGMTIKVEPLLIAMVAGFTVTNFTRYHGEFENLLHDISPYVYVAFFALTGLALKLDVLVATIGIATLLFLVRMAAIVMGTFVGGTLAGESANFRKWAGMGLITQAGIALGLARETAVAFPDTLGGEFATLIISVVVLNEVFGPVLLKFALRQVGESQVPDGNPNRHLVILGAEAQSIALARQMGADGWTVIVADTSLDHIKHRPVDIDLRQLEMLDADTLSQLVKKSSTALVAMLPNDALNYDACQIFNEQFGVESIVVRLRDGSLREKFLKLGARVLDPTSAMVNLLHQYLRAPEAVDLLLHQDPDHDVIQVKVAEKAIDGLPLRDLRLPADVLILEILRDGQVIVPHGFSTLRIADEVTLVGSPNSLSEVVLKLGY